MNHRSLWWAAVALATGVMLWPRPVLAHCDTIDGPVVTAAREALRTGDVNLVLIWVKKGDELEIRKAFERTLAVRKLGSQASELADTHFFETLVRIHRAGEGAPYTGLKPDRRDLGSVIPEADAALHTGNADALVLLLTMTITEDIREHFRQVMALARYPKDDVEAGRRFVNAYVSFIHLVEGIHQATRHSTVVERHVPSDAHGESLGVHPGENQE
jgi:hypothetical protein